MKKVYALTKIFVRDFYHNTKLINKSEKKMNKKSILFWILVLLSIVITFISYKSIHFLISVGVPELFLIIFMTILNFMILYQIAFISTNIFFFSKDLEFVLPLPIKSIELLLAKFNTVLITIYMTEIGFGLIPLILYGFMNFTSFGYFFCVLFILIVLPIFFISIFGGITIILMKILGFIRNKVILQNIIGSILVLVLFFLENQIFGSIENLREENIFISYLIKILTNIPFWEKIKNIIILILLDIASVVMFIIVGGNIYLKTILKSISSSKIRWRKEGKKEIKFNKKKSKIGFQYIKKEIKMLFKQPTFFMHTVFPVIIVLITIIMIVNVLIPIIDESIQNDETIRQSLATLQFNSEMLFVILGIIQFLYSLSSVSLTAISREGRNAVFMKYIPLSLYKQFIYKNIIQVVLNIIVSVVILSLIYYYIPEITLINIILIFIESIVINFINSYLMLILDLRRPYLNWNSEHSVVKQQDNKSFKYALTVGLILIFIYLSNIFKELNVSLLLVIEISIFTIIFIILNQFVKKNINKLFNKIM